MDTEKQNNREIDSVNSSQVTSVQKLQITPKTLSTNFLVSQSAMMSPIIFKQQIHSNILTQTLSSSSNRSQNVLVPQSNEQSQLSVVEQGEKQAVNEVIIHQQKPRNQFETSLNKNAKLRALYKYLGRVMARSNDYSAQGIGRAGQRSDKSHEQGQRNERSIHLKIQSQGLAHQSILLKTVTKQASPKEKKKHNDSIFPNESSLHSILKNAEPDLRVNSSIHSSKLSLNDLGMFQQYNWKQFSSRRGQGFEEESVALGQPRSIEDLAKIKGLRSQKNQKAAKVVVFDEQQVERKRKQSLKGRCNLSGLGVKTSLQLNESSVQELDSSATQVTAEQENQQFQEEDDDEKMSIDIACIEGNKFGDTLLDIKDQKQAQQRAGGDESDRSKLGRWRDTSNSKVTIVNSRSVFGFNEQTSEKTLHLQSKNKMIMLKNPSTKLTQFSKMSRLKHQNSEANKLKKLPNKVILDLNRSMDSVKGVVRQNSIVTQLLISGSGVNQNEENKQMETTQEENLRFPKVTRMSNKNLFITPDRNKNKNSLNISTEERSEEATFVRKDKNETSNCGSLEELGGSMSVLKHNLDNRLQDYLGKINPQEANSSKFRFPQNNVKGNFSQLQQILSFNNLKNESNDKSGDRKTVKLTSFNANLIPNKFTVKMPQINEKQTYSPPKATIMNTSIEQSDQSEGQKWSLKLGILTPIIEKLGKSSTQVNEAAQNPKFDMRSPLKDNEPEQQSSSRRAYVTEQSETRIEKFSLIPKDIMTLRRTRYDRQSEDSQQKSDKRMTQLINSPDDVLSNDNNDKKINAEVMCSISSMNQSFDGASGKQKREPVYSNHKGKNQVEKSLQAQTKRNKTQTNSHTSWKTATIKKLTFPVPDDLTHFKLPKQNMHHQLALIASPHKYPCSPSNIVLSAQKPQKTAPTGPQNAKTRQKASQGQHVQQDTVKQSLQKITQMVIRSGQRKQRDADKLSRIVSSNNAGSVCPSGSNSIECRDRITGSAEKRYESFGERLTRESRESREAHTNNSCTAPAISALIVHTSRFQKNDLQHIMGGESDQEDGHQI